MAENELVNKVRAILSETEAKKPNNFLDKEEATNTKQLSNNSESQVIGDPLTDVKMNQLADDQGSDGDNAPTVSVTTGAETNSNDEHNGQKKPVFHAKTTMTEHQELIENHTLSLLIRNALNESHEVKDAILANLRQKTENQLE